MKIDALKCKKCGDVIFSRCRRDMRWCSCGSIAIDGGFDYTKVTGSPDEIEFVQIMVDANKDELYNDWNTKKDNHGLVKEKK